MDSFAVRAYPRGAVAHAPRVLSKAGWTDGKAAQAGAAKGRFLCTAVTDAIAAASATAWSAGTVPAHFCC